MRHFITILAFLLFLTSCIDNKQQRIEGEWLGYQETFFLDNDTISDYFHRILSIDKDSIRAINFKYITHGNRDSLFRLSYIISDSNLIVNINSKSADTLTIDVLNDTAMILATAKNKYKYSRLSKSKTKTKKIELVNKMFTISDSIQIIDTIEFLDNSALLLYNKKLKSPNQIYEWRLRNYFGHEFFIIDSPEIPVFLITTKTGKDFVLKREPNESMEYNLNETEFQEKLTNNILIGKWVGKSNIPEKEIFFDFTPDSVQMNEFTNGEILTGTYSLNLSGTKMFCFHKYASGIMFYEIEKIRNDSMFLKRLNPVKDSFVLTKVR